MEPNIQKPLRGRTILVASSAAKMVELSALLESMGGKVLPFPVIEVQEIEDKSPLDRAIASLGEYDWILFTSVHGVAFFMRRLRELGTGAPAPMPKICAIGPATARAVEEAGHEVALVPRQFVAEGVVEALDQYCGGLQTLAGRRILIPRAREGRDVLPTALSAAGIRVDLVPCYRTVRAGLEESAIEQIRVVRPDLIIFTSSSTVRNMFDILGPEDGKKKILESVVAVLGPVTEDTVESFGKRAEIVPRENTIASLAGEICSYYSSRR